MWWWVWRGCGGVEDVVVGVVWRGCSGGCEGCAFLAVVFSKAFTFIKFLNYFVN